MDKIELLINELVQSRRLSTDNYGELLLSFNEANAKRLAEAAVKERKRVYKNTVYIRGLIEISNICANDCYYCGIRRSNSECRRYRLTKEDIIECADMGYKLGFRTFVLQSGESAAYTIDELCSIIHAIKNKYSDCAVTLSLGEMEHDEYLALYDAGADRYLLRHETADSEHYKKLHPENMSFEHRIKCLYDLKETGYQTGCGLMVGSPYQTIKTLAKDLKFIEEFSPHMCGIGPYIPHKDTPFADEKPGSIELTLYLLSIIRLIKPEILLPATTALGTLDENGRERGILAGANVVMPNLSPKSAREKYELYNNKLNSGAEAAENLTALKMTVNSIGYEIVTDRGDMKAFSERN